MNVSPIHRRPVSPARWTATPRSETGEEEESLDEQMIAEMPGNRVSDMTRSEMTRVVLASPLAKLRPELKDHLPYMVREDLRRTVHLACLCCRNRLP
jgi:hypothetical protein